jgi:GNAT superfamily N-acetyltransferase
MIELRRMIREDTGFVFDCLKELRGSVTYSLDGFESYLEEHRLIDHADFYILIGADALERIGMLTCNRFSMPRYLGFGYEIEEVVVHPALQGRGYGKALIEAFLSRAALDASVRKVIVKTDDDVRAGRLYARYFDVVQTTVYARAIHRI